MECNSCSKSVKWVDDYKCIIPRIVWRMYLTVGNITQYKWFNKQFTYKSKRAKY